MTPPIPLPASLVAAQLPSVALLGLPVANVASRRALDWLCARLAAGQPTRVAFLNAHCANLAAQDPAYRDALRTADALLPDGSGLAIAARMRGAPLAANLNGTDLIPALCARLAAEGRSLYLLGGRPGVAAAAAAALARAHPGLRIAGTAHGYFAAEDSAAVVERINAAGADVVLAALGVPLQDTWLAAQAPGLAAPLCFGVGGLFDFLSGRIPRAPAALRALGLEWTYRMYQEPARMWRRYVLGNPAFLARAARDAWRGDSPVRRRVEETARRAVDIAAAAALLVLVAPLLLACAAAVRLTSPGPVLLRQVRIGKDGTPFTMFKLRSMYIDAEARRAALVASNQHGQAGVTFKMKRDPRVTPVGRLLRKSSIDELPQLWNVLRGDMSLVGPRPQLPHEVRAYAPAHFLRLAVRPGMTCLWQISGRANLPFERQYLLDLEYLRTRSLWSDLVILLRTVPAVVSARGAY